MTQIQSSPVSSAFSSLVKRSCDWCASTLGDEQAKFCTDTCALHSKVMAENAHRTYDVSLGGEVCRNVAYDAVDGVCAALVATRGPGVPQVVETTPDAFVPPVARWTGPSGEHVLPAPDAPPVAPVLRGDGHIDSAGLARVEAAVAATVANGFAKVQTVYAPGSRVIEYGVARAGLLRAEYDAKPSLAIVCDGLIDRVASEKRATVTVPRTSIRMAASGNLILGGDHAPLPVEERAFRPLVNRLGLPGGAAQYLSACPTRLRSVNANNWQAIHVEQEAAARAAKEADGKTWTQPEIVLLTRNAPESDASHPRVAYGVVSPEYVDFPIDKLAAAMKLAMPEGAKGDATYDGYRGRITALFHSTVAPADYVCGEFFRAAIFLTTDDTGGGSIAGYAAIEQNLCLNLLITSEQAKPIFRIRHTGSVEEIAAAIRDGLKAAEETLAHFLTQWGYARKDDLIEAAIMRGELPRATDPGEIVAGMTMTEVFAALANGIIERDLVPVRGARRETVAALTQAWLDDTSGDGPSAGTVTRAGLVNSLTRWAHKTQDDAFFADKVQIGASALLWPETSRATAPAAIPALPL